MSWTYSLADDRSTLEIYDHTDTLVIAIDNDGSGFQIKQEVLQAMEDAAIAEYQSNGYSPNLLQILRHAIFENIEEK